MSTDSDLTRHRRSRNRRWYVGMAFYLVALYFDIVFMKLLPRHSPLLGVTLLGLAGAWCVTNFLVNGGDEWQRQRALQAFAIGAGTGLVWSALSALWTDLAPVTELAQVEVMNVTALVWMSADYLLRQFTTFRPRNDEAG